MNGIRAFALLAALAHASPVPSQARQADQVRFTEDFERGLGRWEVRGARGVTIRPSGDIAHGNVLVLTPNGDDVLALIRGSAQWRGTRIEGDMFFPSDDDSYLGIAYNVQRRGTRFDFGLIYVKAPESYLLPNPHRDLNVSRLLYEEYRVDLSGVAAARVAVWQRFKAEIVGQECHVYVGGSDTPQLTFALFERNSGGIGLQPRSVGAEVWVDNVRVTSIAQLSYQGPPTPAIRYQPDSLLTEWQVIGPLTTTDDEVARAPAARGRPWRPFPTDSRGAVVTGRVVDFHGARNVAYLRTRVESARAGSAVLHLSSVDDLSLWVNGRFHWFIPRSSLAWHDFWRNPEHTGRRIPIDLVAGTNEIVLRVRGGVYASGGFFARIEQAPATGPVASPSERPTRRSGFGLAFDSRRSRLVLFGGSDSTYTRLGDTWEWWNDRWTRIVGPGPVARSDFAMTYDARRGRVVVFGGRSAAGLEGDTWEFDGAVWVRVDSAGPPPRNLTSTAYDANRGRVVLFGGSGARGRDPSTWEWDGARWRQFPAQSGGPDVRGSHILAYDDTRHRVVLVGGFGNEGLADSWEWDGAAWSRIGDGPAVFHHAAAFDSRLGKLLVFGGFDGNRRSANLWARTPSGWNVIDAAGPIERAEHRGAYVPGVGLVVFGGIGGQGMSVEERGRAKRNDLWAFAGVRWRELGPK